MWQMRRYGRCLNAFTLAMYMMGAAHQGATAAAVGPGAVRRGLGWGARTALGHRSRRRGAGGGRGREIYLSLCLEYRISMPRALLRKYLQSFAAIMYCALS